MTAALLEEALVVPGLRSEPAAPALVSAAEPESRLFDRRYNSPAHRRAQTLLQFIIGAASVRFVVDIQNLLNSYSPAATSLQQTVMSLQRLRFSRRAHNF